MKRLILVALVLMLSAGFSFAGGGKNQIHERGDKGEGSTGASAQGAVVQERGG